MKQLSTPTDPTGSAEMTDRSHGSAFLGCGAAQPQQQHRDLVAALAHVDEAQAMNAWLRWLEASSLEEIDERTFILLATVHRTAKQRKRSFHSPEDAAKVAGAYRQCWYRNQMLMKSTIEVLRAFDRHGITHVTLKGAAVATTAYGDLGARWMADVDVLVPLHQRTQAMDLLLDLGWDPACGKEQLPGHVRMHHSCNLTTGRFASIDLHWGILFIDRNPDADARMIERSIPVEICGMSTRTLSPTDQLIHVLSHGEPLDLRWMIDASMIMHRAALAEIPIDWWLFTNEVIERNVVERVRRNLSILREMTGLSVPVTTEARLQHHRLHRLERLANTLEETFPSRRSSTAAGVHLFVRRTRHMPTLERVELFAPYMSRLFGQTSTSGALRHLARHALRGPSSRSPAKPPSP